MPPNPALFMNAESAPEKAAGTSGQGTALPARDGRCSPTHITTHPPVDDSIHFDVTHLHPGRRYV
eukprot:4609671-Pleurochrysis_carterae.AAC.1